MTNAIKPNHYLNYGTKFEGVNIEPIFYTERLPHRDGAALEYIIRAGHKVREGMTMLESNIEDLSKAKYYIARRICMPIAKDQYDIEQVECLMSLSLNTGNELLAKTHNVASASLKRYPNFNEEDGCDYVRAYYRCLLTFIKDELEALRKEYEG